MGRTWHIDYAHTLGGGDYIFNRETIQGTKMRPDAVDRVQRIVRELKPNNPKAIARGWRQVNQYKAALERITGLPWTAYVDVYTP